MATLVLTAVGTAFGGPLGGAIGALAGNALDHALLGGKAGRGGPRLGDLAVQTSSYGSFVPRLFGTLRVAGTVIWATDLREDTHRSGGGKGGARTTSYSYSASFAVALSSRPILGVGRIWADGKLLRGAAGDWSSETGFRLHPGGEDQAPDPLIAAAEGIAAAPAHRGLAYAVFENLQLADFGNRIPSLTFEVIADPTAVPVGALLATLSDGAATGEGPALGGFAASGETVRAALEAVAQAVPLSLADDGATLRLAPEPVATLDAGALGAAADLRANPRRRLTRAAADALPDGVTLGYYEPARDYQAGLQSARRDGIGRRGSRIELPAALPADEARGLAEAALTRAWIERERLTITLPWRWMTLAAGTRVSLDGRLWRIARRELERMAVTLELVPEAPGAAAVPAGPGRATVAPDLPAGSTVLRLVELPALDDTLADAPRVFLAAAGTGAGWRRAVASLSLDGGASWSALGTTTAPAILGTALAPLAAGPFVLRDDVATVEVELLHRGMALADATPALLAAGANLALLGGELLQFGTARQLSPTRWRLGQLLRGRRGTEGAIGGHEAGERFLLVEPATLLPLAIGSAQLGATLTVSGTAPGETTPATDTLIVTGRALRPPAPVRLTAERGADGTVRLGWTRRSRLGWAWIDGGDAPLGEEREAYRLVVQGTGGAPRTIETDRPAADYSPEQAAADGWSGSGQLTATLVQIGTRAASDPPATASWTFRGEPS